jgi:hypothetical protein
VHSKHPEKSHSLVYTFRSGSYECISKTERPAAEETVEPDKKAPTANVEKDRHSKARSAKPKVISENRMVRQHKANPKSVGPPGGELDPRSFLDR